MICGKNFISDKNPKISVIMSVYNAQRYLQEAIDSLLQQTFKNFEFIIINDGSTDATIDILNRYNDHRIIIINHPRNLGLARSLNNAIGLAKGKYIARMDADDISLPHRLSKQLTYLEHNPEIAVLGSAYYEIDEYNNVSKLVQLFCEDEQIKRQLCLGQFSIAHPTAMIRKDALLDVGAYNENLMFTQDKDLWIRLAGKGYKFANLREPTLKKRELKNHPYYEDFIKKHRISRDYVYSMNSSIVNSLWEKYKDLEIPPLSESKLNWLERKAYAELYFRLGCGLYSLSQISLARKAFFVSLRCYPFNRMTYYSWLSTFALFKTGWRGIKKL
jgi:glycosyltransferase involved in cell wall biosynthesis